MLHLSRLQVWTLLASCPTVFTFLVEVRPPSGAVTLQSGKHHSFGGSFSRATHASSVRRKVRRNAATAAEQVETFPIAAEEDLPELTQAEVRRYSRHLILPDVGVEGQRQLKQARVLCIGAGGLGSPALLYLAAAGVGTLGIVDDDVVDESNLQRQVIHGEATLGVPKVRSAEARVLDMNPNCKVLTVQAKLTSANALDILGGYDIVLDGSDNFPTKYLVSDACHLLGIPCVYGAILGFEGQASVFGYRGGPTYRDLMPTPPPPGEVPSCAEGGVLGILPGVIGCIQATEVIKIILRKGEVLSGRLLIYDALKMTFREVALRRREGAAPVTELVDYDGFCGFSAAPKKSAATAAAGGSSSTSAVGAALRKLATAPAAGASATPPAPPEASDAQKDASDARKDPFERLSVQETWARLQDGWAPFVLDVRLPQEAAIASLPFADMLCPHREVSSVAEQLPRDADILVLCKAGARSQKACEALAAEGFDRLYSLDGGIVAWAREIDPSLATY